MFGSNKNRKKSFFTQNCRLYEDTTTVTEVATTRLSRESEHNVWQWHPQAIPVHVLQEIVFFA
jgi:hypothetical protein